MINNYSPIINSRILIRGADTVGSFVLATPFYRELRKNFPTAYIVLCIKPLVYELAKDCPYVDKVIIYNAQSLKQKLDYIKSLKQEKFDTVFLISGSFESAMICYFAGIKNRIGYSHDHRGWLLTHRIIEKERKHYIDYILYILESLRFKITDRSPEVYTKEQNITLINNEILKQIHDEIEQNDKDKKIVGLNFTVAGEISRTWPKDYAVDLVNKLINKNFITILFGTKKDTDYGNFLENKIKNKNFINLVGKTSLTDFVNLVKKCNIYISVATGGIHIASVLGVKTIGLYCSGDEIGWCPWGKNVEIISKQLQCSPCTQHKMKYCKDNICMKQITPEEVYKKVEVFRNTMEI